MSRFHNRTRRSASIPGRLVREGKWHLLPLYSLLLTSDLAREGIRNSGSYRFADHIYANRPSGRHGIGLVVDALLLNLPSARSFRSRYLFAKQEIRSLIADRAPRADALDILAVPCGLARELFEVAAELLENRYPYRSKIRWSGMDLDPGVIETVSCRARHSGALMEFWTGDAFAPAAYRRGYDMVVSMGFTEFLDDRQTVDFYRTVLTHLNPDGVFVTSGMTPHALSDYLMRQLAELETSYRDRQALVKLARQAGFPAPSTYQDPCGLQTMLIAVNG